MPTTVPHRRRRPLTAAVGVCTAALVLLTGCSVADQSRDAGPAEAGRGPRTVTFITHDSFDPPAELLEEFTETTGYELKTTSPGDAGTVVNQLLLSEGAPAVDGVYGVEDHSAHTLTEAGVLAPFAPEGLPESAQQRTVGAGMVPIDQGQVCVNVDHGWFAAQGRAEPQSLQELADPEFASLLVVTDPVTSSPGLSFLAATVAAEGEDGWRRWWSDALDGGMAVTASWSDAYYTDFSGADGDGDRPLVLSYSSSPAFAPDTGVVEGTCTPQTEYAGVLQGAENPEGAQAFIEFMLQRGFQEAIPESLYMYPIDESVDLPADWAEHAPLAEDPITPDPAQVAEHRERWLRELTALRENR